MTDQYLRNRLASRGSALRASDAEREEVAERLRSGHAEGRLDLSEFQERLEQCYAAKTFGELAPLVADLPRRDGELARRGGPRRVAATPLLPLAWLLVVLLVLSAAAGHHVFWVWIPLAFLASRLFAARRGRHWAAGRGGWGGRG